MKLSALYLTAAATLAAATASRPTRQERLRRALLAPKPETHYSDPAYMPPNAVVDYGGKHPFELHERRQLFSEGDAHRSNLNYDENDEDNCNPIRIRFVTDALEQQRGVSDLIDEQIDFILDKTLPALASTWAGHLSLTSAQSPIPVSNDLCYGHFDGTFSGDVLANGVSDADLVIIVSGSDTLGTNFGQEWAVCPPKLIALASICTLDQFDRPIVGFINFCLPLGSLEQTSSEYDVRKLEGEEHEFEEHGYSALRYTQDEEEDTLRIALHESAHVLGMDSALIKYFRNPESGTPLTPRPFIPRTVKCVDGASRVTIMPSMQTVEQNITQRGLVYYDLITPRVATVARNHFNCPDISGIRLENQNVGSGCFGSHLDERLYFTEIMGARYSGEVDILSPLTLAFMEDTGWYKASYEGISMSPFGTGMGCDFVFGDCIVNDQVADWGQDTFCDTPSKFGADEELSYRTDTNAVYSWNPIVCDPSHTAFAVCNLFDEESIPSDQVGSLNFGYDNIAPAIRYFTNEHLVSSFAEGDYCPLPIRDVGVDCTTSSDYTAIYLGETTGAGSRCINAHYDVDGGGQVERAACMPVTCDDDLKKVVIGMGTLAQVCEYDNQVLEWTNAVYMKCPRLSTVCPHYFCPASCSARGICDWAAEPTPRCECFDENDTSDGCYGDMRRPTPSPATALRPTTAPGALVLPSGNDRPTSTQLDGVASSAPSVLSYSTATMLLCIALYL